MDQMKIDVVYPLANTSKFHDDFELRYSLRSLDAQPWAGNVFFVGHRPAWAKNVTHIPCADPWGPGAAFKDKNIIKKMLVACGDVRVSESFVANSDDQYWMRVVEPGDMEIPPREHPAQMDTDMRVSRGNFRQFRNLWVRRQYDTVTFLKKNGKNDIRFDGHVPYIVQKDKYLKTMASIPWEMGNGFLIVVYHGWNFAPRNGFKIESLDGRLVRIRQETARKQIEEMTREAYFLNHNNRALTPAMKDFLQAKFPKPSRWE